MNSRSDHAKVILVTGCGSGLGLTIARKLYSMKNFRAVITARKNSYQRLKQIFVENERFIIRELDVTDPAQVHPLINEICCQWGRVDVLVNNAAVCFRSVVEHMDPEAEMIQLKTNYLGPMNLARSILPVMREQRQGHIINISSASGSIAMPTMGSYGASKHALEAASEALWYEARPFGIHVSVVQPGLIQSDAHQNVVLSKKAILSSELGGPHAEYYASMAPFIAALMKISRVNYDKVADRVLKLATMKNPPLVNVVTPDAKLLRFFRWILPHETFHKFIFRLLPGSKNWGQKTIPKVPFKLFPQVSWRP